MSEVLQSLYVPTVMVGGLTVTTLSFLVGVGLFILAFLAMRAPGLRSKIVSIAMVLVCLATMSIALAEQLSHPKELSIVWLKAQGRNGVSVHKSIIQPPTKIHLWIDVNGEPRAFWVAWTKELEESLQAAIGETEDGAKGSLRFRFEKSLDEDSPKFYAMPWPAPPPKGEDPQRAPQRFEQEA